VVCRAAGHSTVTLPFWLPTSTVPVVAPVRTSTPAALARRPATGSVLPLRAAPTAWAIEVLPTAFKPPTRAIGAHVNRASAQPRKLRTAISIVIGLDLELDLPATARRLRLILRRRAVLGHRHRRRLGPAALAALLLNPLGGGLRGGRRVPLPA